MIFKTTLTRLRHSILCAGLLCVTAVSVNAATCAGMNPNSFKTDQAIIARTCTNKKMIDFFWDGYGFDTEMWKKNGFHNTCDLNFPLANMFNGLYILHYSMPDIPTKTSDRSGNILRWGAGYSLHVIDDLWYKCGNSKTGYAEVIHGAEKEVIVYRDLLTKHPLIRASITLHEARHWDYGMDHVQNKWNGVNWDADYSLEHFKKPYKYGTGSSGWITGSYVGSDGKVYPPPGAYGYETKWLWWFAHEGREVSDTTRELACRLANSNFQKRFQNDANWCTYFGQKR